MHWNPIPEEELRQRCREMEEFEKSGALSEIFKGECQEHRQLPNKERLLESIDPDMKLYKSTFKKIYGYEISFPGYADQALAELEKAGCSKAREYYQRIAGEIEKEHDEMMKRVGEWYRNFTEKKGSDGLRKKQQEVEQRKKMQWAELSKMLGYQ